MPTISSWQRQVATTDTAWNYITTHPQEIASSTGNKISEIRSTRVELTIPHWFEFESLVAKWHEERGASSSTTKIAMCPSYQRIIGMGEDAVPLILRAMEKEGDEPDHWFWALSVITGVDPVAPDARGDIVGMANAWLEWGRRRYAW